MDKKKKKLNLPMTRWQIRDTPAEAGNLLVRELGVHAVLSRILVSRSFVDPDEARAYLYPTLNNLHNPFLMKDMKKGVDRVLQSLHNGEHIVIYGDYDVDGITSIAILLKFLKQLRANVSFYIPDRILEGYGVNLKAVEKIRQDGAALLITVDCGISDHAAVSHAKSLGMDTVILDHHEVQETLPEAAAVINTNRTDCVFPFKQLAGVGIVFNFLIALRGKLRDLGFWKDQPYPNLREYLDLVALGTIGDISPLIDENRIFARIGLDLINQGRRVGLQALRDVCGSADHPVDSAVASFSLIPRINAAGRIASADDAVRLLMTEDRNEALEISRRLDSYNRNRQSIERNTLNEIMGEIGKTLNVEDLGVIVLSSPDWHPGVIGIVASKLVDLYYRPAILISLKDGIGKGSGRSIPEFNLYRGLTHCQSYLLAHGGHRYAAGVTIREENVDALRATLDKMIRTELPLSDLIPQIAVDSYCGLEDIDHDLLAQLDLLAPHGSMNPEPLLYTRSVSITSPVIVGNNHLKMRVNSQTFSCGSIWFGKGQFLGVLADSKFDIVFTPQRNHWNGTTTIQLKVKDMAKSH